jgi:hypothetical protein
MLMLRFGKKKRGLEGFSSFLTRLVAQKGLPRYVRAISLLTFAVHILYGFMGERG